MDTTTENKFIVETFKTVKHIEQMKYRKGLSIRQTILNKLSNGEEVDNYRMKFLTDSIFKVFKFLEEIGLEFNKNNPQDCFTTQDLSDILCNCIAIVENKRSN